MKKFIKENRVTLSVVIVSLGLYGLITFISSDIAKPDSVITPKTIVTTKGVKLYEMKEKVTAFYEGENVLHYSLSFPSNIVRETKKSGKETSFYYNGVKVAELAFSYEGGRGYTSLEYLSEVLGKKIPLAIDKNEVTFGKYTYITAGATDSYFRVTSFKQGNWLGALEVLSNNEELEKVLLTSLSVY